jgi:hypothetical protein
MPGPLVQTYLYQRGDERRGVLKPYTRQREGGQFQRQNL